MKALSRAGVIVLTGLSVAGCATGSYAPDKLERRLESTGVAATAAKCVVAKMTDTFGERRLGGREEPSESELQAERRLFRECKVKAG